MTAHRNSFDGIRLVAALLVVFGHAWSLWSVSAEVPRVLGIRFEALGLAIFFALSGYLIAKSWDRARSSSVFLWHRALRIFPALWATVFITAFVIGPIISVVTTSGREWWTGLLNYFTTGQPFAYVSGAFLIPQYQLAGFLPYSGGVVNGSLWTIGVEFVCYLLVLIVGVTVARGRAAVMAVLAVACALIDTIGSTVAWLEPLQDAARVATYFALGALLASISPAVLRVRWLPVVTVLAWVLAHVAAPTMAQLWAWMAIPVLVVTIGELSIPGLRVAARRGDLTYGIYLWSFPVTQLVTWVPVAMPFAVRLLIVVAITAGLAWLSWTFIERPALALKSAISRPTQVPHERGGSRIRETGFVPS